MNDTQFIEKYCHNCGSQRCEGIGTDWFEGCRFRWNHDSYDAATEIDRLNKKIIELATKLAKMTKEAGEIKTNFNCEKCVYESICIKDKRTLIDCPDYKRDPPDGGYYG